MEQTNGREPAEHLVGRSYIQRKARYHRDIPTRVLPLSHKYAWLLVIHHISVREVFNMPLAIDVDNDMQMFINNERKRA